MKHVQMAVMYVSLCLAFLLLSGCGGEKANETTPLSLKAESGSYTATLDITPGIVGPNTYVASIADEAGNLQTEGEVILHFSMSGMDHGKSTQELSLTNDNRWQGEGPHFMMGGKWDVQLVWSKPDKENQTFSFEIELPE